MTRTKPSFYKLWIGLALFVLVISNLIGSPRVFAGTLTNSSVILYNMNASGTGQFAIVFKAASSATNNITINFQAAWTGAGGSVAGTQSNPTTAGCTTLYPTATALPGTLTAAGSGTTVTISGVTALTSGTTYCAIVPTAAALTNPSAGVYSVVVTDGTDSVTDAVDVIANDQVTVNATVPPSFTLTLGGSSFPTDNLGTLSTGSITGTASTFITATIGTNAKTGWILWGSDSNTGLRSAIQSYTIAAKTPGTNGSLSAGTEGFLTGIPAAGITQGSGAGVTSATTAYASSGSGNGSGFDSSQRQIASSTGTANGAIVTLHNYAAISSITPASSDYTDTITIIGAGSF